MLQVSVTNERGEVLLRYHAHRDGTPTKSNLAQQVAPDQDACPAVWRAMQAATRIISPRWLFETVQ